MPLHRDGSRFLISVCKLDNASIFVAQLINSKSFFHIKIHLIPQDTPDNPGQFVG